MELSARDVEEAAAAALDDMPTDILRLLDNVVVVVELEPPAELEGCLGVYEGIPLTERYADPPMLPDRITVFAGPLLRMCQDAEELRAEVGITVVHELAHHFGIDDDRLAELGWD